MSSFDVVFDQGSSFNVDFGVSIPQYDYEGSYNITPTEEQQTLITANRLCEHNIVVDSIPSQYVVPSGTETITTLGIHNIADKENVNIQTALKKYIMRPDAELLQTFTYDKLIVTDEKVTLPEYSTTAVYIKETEILEPVVPTDWDNYRYYVIVRMLTIPIYNTTAKLKGRCEYCVTDQFYELFYIPSNTVISLVDTSDIITAVGIGQQGGGGASRQPYYSADNVFNLYTSTTYGASQLAQAPSVNSNRIQVRSPRFQMRGSSTYLPSNVWSKITDIRFQWVTEVWRSPLNSLGLEGWGTLQDMLHMIDCAQSNTHKLT